jgi:hypothetical protein
MQAWQSIRQKTTSILLNETKPEAITAYVFLFTDVIGKDYFSLNQSRFYV